MSSPMTWSLARWALCAGWAVAFPALGAHIGHVNGDGTGDVHPGRAPADLSAAAIAEYTDCEPQAAQIVFDHGYTVSMCVEYDKDGETVKTDALNYELESRESGLLYFFDRDNAEVLIKVLDGCAVNGHRWVFVGPVTSLAFNLYVDETASGMRWRHRNARGGQTARAVGDVTAFPCEATGSSMVEASVVSTLQRPAVSDPLPAAKVAQGISAGSGTDCEPQPVTTLRGGYTVNMCVEYEKDGEAVVAAPKDYGLDSEQSALLYFFDRNNAEVLIKVLDGCAVNGHRWVFVASATTLAFNMTVESPYGDEPWTHDNVLNRTATTKSDIEAFPCRTRPEVVRGCDSERPSYVGYVAGFRGSSEGLEAVLTGPGTLQVARPDSGGCFAFHDVSPGRYGIKVNAQGHRTTPARVVEFPFHDVVDAKTHDVQELPINPFTYHWEEDQTTAGAEYSSHIVNPRVVEFRGETVDVADAAAAARLTQDYNILLVDEGWSQEHAFRLFDTMQSIPQRVQDPVNDFALPASTWRRTDDFIDGDIAIVAAEDGTREVTISSAAFVSAAPRIATVDGKRGVWFSRRLHHAAVRFVTDNGRDERAYEKIFQEGYGVTTRIEDYPALTGPTGNESHFNFQSFQAGEILLLINMLEEMPAGMHKIDGMRYLVRRLDGLPHPLYPTAPAVAWPESAYVEFMERAFKQQTEDYMHRLIIHEKSHFLWSHLFDDQLKADWTELGGWYEDPGAASGWSTTKSAEFVSAYAHLKNPNEDMAETISYFIVNPDRLRARSTAKYEFVRDRIMQGDIYVALIREDLTFEVYNLFPDYVYPGKIRRVDIAVEGGPNEDKRLTLDIELHALDGEAEGATVGLTRITSAVGTYFDLWLYPIDEYGSRLDEGDVATRLRGEIAMSKHFKAGYWLPVQIVLSDAAGNERYQRTSDFGWSMYVDNYLEDYLPPQYVAGTVAMNSTVWEEDDTVQVIHVDWLVNEEGTMDTCYAAINDARPDTYSLEEYGDPGDAGDECSVDFLMPNYMPSSTYSTNYIRMFDVALNINGVEFTGDDAAEPPATIELKTTNPDTEPPEIDVNQIEVSAEPTNPEAPNGETEVTVSFRHRDNISGLTASQLILRDPQGGNHFYGVYPDDREDLYPSGDPTGWEVMKRVVILPPGSIPGTWGIAEITARDRAGNFKQYNFVEIVHFDVEGDS